MMRYLVLSDIHANLEALESRCPRPASGMPCSCSVISLATVPIQTP